MKICYLANDFDAPGCYRCLFPGRRLADRGHTVTQPPYEETVTEEGRYHVRYEVNLAPATPEADIWVLQQRKERMWPQEGIRLLRQQGIAVAADVDDYYENLPVYNPSAVGSHPYRRGDQVISKRERDFAVKNPEAYVRRLGITGEPAKDLIRVLRKGKFPKNPFNRDYMHEGFKQVDAMSVSTPFLKKAYSKLNPNITVIRNYLEWDMWADITPAYLQKRERKRVGYMGAFKYRQGDLDVIREVIPLFLREHPEVDFVANSVGVHDYLKVPKEQRITYPERPFRPRAEVVNKYGQKVEETHFALHEITNVMDVGLVPLALNDLNQAKSHLKGMEYNACGIPFIASPTGSYKDYWVDEGRNGLLAYSKYDWYDLMGLLLKYDDLRQEMGVFGRKKAEMNSLQENIGEWESFYLGLLGDDFHTLARRAQKQGAIQKVGELAPLLSFLARRKPRVVVEIGSARGGTFWAWCQVASDDATIVSIDLPGGDFGGSELDKVARGEPDKYGHRNTDRMRSYAREQQKAAFIRGNSQSPETRRKLQTILRGQPIDFLMIDGDHAYEGVRRDYELYRDLVRDGGAIAFHDILPHGSQNASEVDKLWEEVKFDYESIEFCTPDEDWGWGRWGGIGVLLK